MVDGSGTETRAYDDLDRLASVSRTGGAFAYVYDVAGNVTRRTYPDGTVVDLTYDPLNRLATVAQGGRTTSYAYDPASNPVTTTLPAANGYVETRTYDQAGRLNGVKNVKGATVLADIVYTRDPVGNPLTETRTGASPLSKTFQYDQMDRLTGVCFLATQCPGGSDPFVRWTYDGLGNRLSEDRPAGTTAYSYDNMDRMLTAGASSFTYDRNGNQLTGGGITMSYDLAGRVKTLLQGSTTTTYSYDGDGKRLQASKGTAASKKTNFSWDVTAGLPELVLERNGNNALRRRYVQGLRPVFMSTSASNAYYFHYDPLGSVRNVTTSSGGTSLTYDYEPFGAIRTQSGSLTNYVRFAGEYQDPTGLIHLRARQYDAAVGRFTRRDPAGQAPGGAVLSSYVYAGDRPTVMVDGSGLWAMPSAGVAPYAVLAASPRYTTIHDEVVNYAAGVLRAALTSVGKVAFGPTSVTTTRADNRLNGASGGVFSDNNGYADMIMWVELSKTALVWEFKSVGQSRTSARQQIERYTGAVGRTKPGWVGAAGFRLPPVGHWVAKTSGGPRTVGPDTDVPGLEWYGPVGRTRRPPALPVVAAPAAVGALAASVRQLLQSALVIRSGVCRPGQACV